MRVFLTKLPDESFVDESRPMRSFFYGKIRLLRVLLTIVDP